MKKLEEYVVSIPDYPEKGIIFRDVTSILEDPEGLQLSIQELQDKLDGVDFNIVIGPESRGFIFGMPIAYNLHKAFVPIRKKGIWKCRDRDPQAFDQTGRQGCDRRRPDGNRRYGRSDDQTDRRTWR